PINDNNNISTLPTFTSIEQENATMWSSSFSWDIQATSELDAQNIEGSSFDEVGEFKGENTNDFYDYQIKNNLFMMVLMILKWRKIESVNVITKENHNLEIQMNHLRFVTDTWFS
ncbi:205_t:CDS:2, partial [Funneliformis mosseae]